MIRDIAVTHKPMRIGLFVDDVIDDDDDLDWEAPTWFYGQLIARVDRLAQSLADSVMFDCIRQEEDITATSK